MTTVQIVDDEALARRRLRRMVEQCDGFECIAEASNGYAALAQFHKCSPDIVLLDVRMPEIDGLEVAEYLAKQRPPPGVIFTTAYERYALNAFDANALGYLLKPVRAQRLEEALANVKRLLEPLAVQLEAKHTSSQLTLCIHDKGETIVIKLDDVLYFMAEQKYTCVMTKNGEYWVEDSLASLAERFGDGLLKTHRSVLVNTLYIRGLKNCADGSHCILLDQTDKELPVSRRHVSDLRAWLKVRERAES